MGANRIGSWRRVGSVLATMPSARDGRGCALELKTLRYFLAVADEQSFTKAAEALYVTQPALSRQMMALENELGVQLYNRGSRSITLTESGQRLRERAQEIVALVDKASSDLAAANEEIAGSICIGAGESFTSVAVAKAAARLRERCPRITYHLRSGNAVDLLQRLDAGQLDFCLIIQPVDISRYHSWRAAERDTWGLIVRRDNPLADKDAIERDDLLREPLIFSEQNTGSFSLNQPFMDWFGAGFETLNVVATYNLAFNATLFAAEGFGSVVALTNQLRLDQASDLVFRPFAPLLQAESHLVWKKNRALSPAAAEFLREFESANPLS